MPTEVGPKKVEQLVDRGIKRLDNFRKARLMFLKQYVGPYYDKDHGLVGKNPLNLIFNAIRVLIPNLVMNHPKHNVQSKFAAHRQYAELLALALDQQGQDMRLHKEYRRWIVDAVFTLGIMKTGLASSEQLITFEDGEVDPGSVYSQTIDFDNFVIDPDLRGDLQEAAFLGDKIRVAKSDLLESGLYNNELVEKLRSTAERLDDDQVAELSRKGINPLQEDLDNQVEVVELWVPKARAIVTVPAEKMGFDEFLRVEDYYGPDEGPYTFLSFTPEVPGNPLPISMVGIWHDLHILANKMAHKIITQADRQKDVVGYRRAAADDAAEVRDAADGEMVAMDDPESVKTFSFGGQQASNETHIAQLQIWFNQMSGNPDQLSGAGLDAESATEAQILAQNSGTILQDMKNTIAGAASEEARKRAWYLHTDPLIEVPLTRRERTPSMVQQKPDGTLMIIPGQEAEVQTFLTPEMRRGDFLDYNLKIEPESMNQVDSAVRLKRAMDFAVRVLPAAASAAQVSIQMGTPFSFPRFVTRMAKEMGIEWLDEVFGDPELQQQMMVLQQMLPGAEGSQANIQPKMSVASQSSLGAVTQNGQPANVASVPSAAKEQRQTQQSGSQQSQQENQLNAV